MSSIETFSSVPQMIAAVRSTGSHFFDADTMKHWGTRIHGGIRRGHYFITSDWVDLERTQRGYSVRWFERNNKGNLTGEKAGDQLGKFATESEALDYINSLEA